MRRAAVYVENAVPMNPHLEMRERYTPDAELDALIRAGLGNVEREHITPEMRAAALRGEKVQVGWRHHTRCIACGGKRDNPAYCYCRRCVNETLKTHRARKRRIAGRR